MLLCIVSFILKSPLTIQKYWFSFLFVVHIIFQHGHFFTSEILGKGKDPTTPRKEFGCGSMKLSELNAKIRQRNLTRLKWPKAFQKSWKGKFPLETKVVPLIRAEKTRLSNKSSEKRVSKIQPQPIYSLLISSLKAV